MRFKEIEDGYLDTNNGIVWQKEQCKDKFTFKEAIEYCESLRDGWRLPTTKELISIIDYEKGNPATDLPGMRWSSYWSSTTYANNTDYAWQVDFYNGYVDSLSKSGLYYVRAVKDYII